MKTLGQILFCGDTHGRHAHVLEAAQRLQPMAVVLLGDMEFGQPAHLELAPIRDIVWWIHGNHDTDREASWAHLIDGEFAQRCVDGRVVTLPDGTRLAGLGGVFREKVWAPPALAVHASYEAWLTWLESRWHQSAAVGASERLRHHSTIFEEVYDRLAADSADILVTHEAPSPHRYGWPALNELARAMGVRQVFHGHQHDRPDYRAHWRRLGHEVHGVGLRGISARDGEVIVPGELDAARGSGRSTDW